MLQINKIEPAFFTTVKGKTKNQKQSDAWSRINIDKDVLREHILVEEQNLMCAYCEKKINVSRQKSNTDHFKTRHAYPELTLEYSNLFVSCKSPNHCESIKDKFGLEKKDFDNILNPLHDKQIDNFKYTSFGEIEPLNEKAKFTKECFNLNSISLVEERIQIINNIESYNDFETDILIDCLGGHINLIKFLKNEDI
jgi:uncharacterized protein (TIGR02646 family)